MKLEQKMKNIIFETTELPDLFFTEYLSVANSDAVKVYLYMLFLSKHNKDIKLGDISKMLGLSFQVIQDSIKFWEEAGVVYKKNNGYILQNLQDLALAKLYKPKINLSPEAIAKNEKNQYRAKAIEAINSSCFQGMMSPTWYSDIDMWFTKYGFDEQVMIALFQYCFNLSKMHKNYIHAVAKDWNSHGVKTFTDLDLYYAKKDKINIIKKGIIKKLNLNRDVTSFENDYIEKWVITYGFNMDIIEIALKKTTAKTNPSFNYIDKILSDWHVNNYKNKEDIAKADADFKQKQKNIKNLEKQTKTNSSKFNNYNQRSYDNLSNLYANLPGASNQD